MLNQLLLIGNLGMGELIIILVIILLLFGAKKIPDLMKGLGRGVRSFKEGMNEVKNDIEAPADDKKEEKTELLDERLTAETFATLAGEDPIYQEAPNAKQADYIRRLVKGVDEHAAELDGYIAKYAKGWSFSRIPLVASAIMRVAMYEILYMQDVPNSAAINEAVEIAKKYETPETVKFINGILGSFVRQEVTE